MTSTKIQRLNNKRMKIKKILKHITLAAITLALLGAVLFLCSYWQLNKSYEDRFNSYKTEYLNRLNILVDGKHSPEKASDIHAFLSLNSINEILSLIKGQTHLLSNEASLNISDLGLTSQSGVPLVQLTGTLKIKKFIPINVEIEGVATLSPLEARHKTFVTRLHIVALKPKLSSAGLKLALNGFVGDLIKSIGQQQIDKLPLISFPLATEVNIPVSGSTTDIKFNVRPRTKDTLSGKIRLEGFNLTSSLAIKDAIFLQDGIHLFLNEGLTNEQVPDDPKWLSLSREQRLETLSEKNVSYFARVRFESVNNLLSKITSLPASKRTANFTSTGLSGYLYKWDHRVRRFGVHLYTVEKKAYLEHKDSAKASVQIVSLKMFPKADALFGLNLRSVLSGKVQIHWHYDPGPGGGFGGNVGVEVPRKEVALLGSVHLVSNPTPILQARLDGPPNVSIGISVGLGKLGKYNFDQKVSLPQTVLFSAPVPTTIQEDVNITVNNNIIRRKVRLSELSAKQSSDLLVVSGNLTLVNTD